MLPAPFSHRLSLADVLPSVLSSLSGQPNALGLGPVKTAIVLVVDGLGAHMLKSRAGHARTLSGARWAGLQSGFPTTTASALSTLATGVPPGIHGMVGYTARDPATGRVVNQLSGWDDLLEPGLWQRATTQFELAVTQGIPAIAVGAARYEDSGFTHSVLRGAEYVVAAAISDRLEVARAHLSTAGTGIAYVYVPELDQIAHRLGWESERWLAELEVLDAAVRAFTSGAKRSEGLLVTADHGMVDVAPHQHVLYDTLDGLLDGVVAVAGEPRCLQLHLDPELSASERSAVFSRWVAAESARSWVASRAEAIAAGWFGPQVDDEVIPRLGDVFVAARKRVAYYDSRVASPSALAMVGQHGSLTPEESVVPLAKLGGYA